MPKADREQKIQTDLSAVRLALSNGQTEEATNRLGAICFYIPLDICHYQEIGDLYWELGFPAMAGRYWYLLDNKTDQMLAACDEFERSLGNIPALILRSLEFGLFNPPSGVESKLEDLRSREANFHLEHQGSSIRDRIVLLGCSILMVVVMFIFLMGIFSIIKWFH